MLVAVALTAGATLLVAVPSVGYSPTGLARRPTLVEYVAVLVFAYGGVALLAGLHLVASGRGLSYLDVAVPRGRQWAVLAGGGVGTLVLLALALWVPQEVLGVRVPEPGPFVPVLEGTVRGGPPGPERLLVALPLVLLVLVPAEELLFRNVVQKRLGEHLPLRAAVAVSSILFAGYSLVAYGGPDPASAAVVFLAAFGVSLLWGYIYARTRTVVVPVLLHYLPYVVGSGLLYYLAVTARA